MERLGHKDEIGRSTVNGNMRMERINYTGKSEWRI